MTTSLDEKIDAAAMDARREQARRRKRWGWGFAALLTLGTLVLCGGGYFAFDSIDRRLGEEAVERVRAAGDPLTPEEIRASYPTSLAIEEATAHWIRAYSAADEAYKTPAAQTLPYIGPATIVPTLDERGYYDAAAVAAYRPVLDGPFARALREAHLAREAGATARYMLDSEKDYTDEISGVRTIGNLFAVEMQVRAGEGDFDGAVDSVLGILAASESLQHEPWYVPLLVRVALLGVASSHALELAHRGDLDDEQLRRLQEAFARQDLLPQTLHAVRGEQYLFLRTFDGPTPKHPNVAPMPQDPSVARLRSLPFRGADKAKGIELHQDFLAEAEQGFPEALAASERIAAIEDELVGSPWGHYRYAVTAYSGTSPGMILNAVLRAQTDASVVAAYAACRRYRLTHDEWPESLENLVPEFVPNLPIDPSLDQPLEYEADGEVIRFRTHLYKQPVNQVDVWFLDGIGRHVLDASRPADEGRR